MTAMRKRKNATPESKGARQHDKLDAKDLALLRAILDSPGIKTMELAKIVGLQRPAVSVRMNRTVFKLELERRQLGALERLTKAQGRAVDRLLELLEQKRNPAIALRAALFILAPLREKDQQQPDQFQDFLQFMEEANRRYLAKQNGGSDWSKRTKAPNKTEQERTKTPDSIVLPMVSGRRRPPPARAPDATG